MRRIFVFSVIVLVLLLLIPLFALGESVAQPAKTTANSLPQPTNTNDFKILLTQQNQIVTLSVEDYLLGVLTGEMPALYQSEALKAQAVCAYTFALWRKNENVDKPYDITDDYTHDQCYLTPQAAQEKWGDKANEYETKLRAAIKEVEYEALTCDGKIILAVYHALSSGKTEAAKNVWGKDYPYLQAASSIGDKLAANYVSTATFTASQIEQAFSVGLPEGLKGSFTDFSRTESGYVNTVKIANTEFSGSAVREALKLKSASFEVALKDEGFIFTVYGYGHGVGMSQNGANYMALQGCNYKEILNHYYKDCQITKTQ